MGFDRFFYSFEAYFPVLFMVVFLMVIGMFIYVVGYRVFESIKNQKSPELVRDAKVLTKRTEVGHYARGHHRVNYGAGPYTYTRYFVTFELKDRSRKEFQVTNKDYGLIAEGDEGRLFFRGTRFQGFERNLD
ncbi:MAG: DUF2500 domain-containing protein [Firmicutes bacterium]|nr:DUF2500 domain-containing protein [Bacillota bacterium]MDD4263232.1 DUF2500 domain-containing protein [Bacillota bacterium]MDD4693662.1 DUF2500 domain-containing protein [Bacillota bacterium]